MLLSVLLTGLSINYLGLVELWSSVKDVLSDLLRVFGDGKGMQGQSGEVCKHVANFEISKYIREYLEFPYLKDIFTIK